MSPTEVTLKLREFRNNYIETLKKLISIEEEIEKTVFYFQRLERQEQQKTFETYQSYIQNLQTLRTDLTTLMQDNLSTVQTFFSSVQKENNLSAIEMLSKIYSDFMNFVSDIYNPFYWWSPQSKK